MGTVCPGSPRDATSSEKSSGRLRVALLGGDVFLPAEFGHSVPQPGTFCDLTPGDCGSLQQGPSDTCSEWRRQRLSEAGVPALVSMGQRRGPQVCNEEAAGLGPATNPRSSLDSYLSLAAGTLRSVG